MIRSPWIQTYVAHLVASYYSAELGTDVDVESVKIYGLDYVEITGLQIKDLKGDTLIYSPKFSGSVEMLSMRSKFAILKAINSNDARVKLQKYKGDAATNMQFLIDYFASEDTTESQFKIKINEINLSNLHFSFDNWNIEPIPYGMDYNHLDLKHINGKVASLRNRNGVTTFSLDSVSLQDKSGFVLDHLHCYFLASDKKIKFEDLSILTPHSSMDVKGLSFNYHDYGDLSDFVNAVVMKGNINPSRLNLQDLSYFAPVFEKFKNNIKIEGILDGTVSNFNIKDLYLGLSPVTYYSGEVDIKGLPYVDQALFYMNINSLQTSAEDLRKFDYQAMGLEEGLEIPNQLDRLGVVKLAGTIDGFLDEFYTNLMVESNAGNVSAYLQAGIDSVYTLNYTGDISTQNVALGDLIGQADVGNLTSEFSLKGRGVSTDNLESIVIGKIHNFDLFGYNYEQIDIQGDIFHKKFKGALDIFDNNLDFSFNGTVDMNSRTPRYNFIADIGKANFHELHLIDRPTSSFKGRIEVVNSTGSTLDNFKGKVIVDGAEYYENGINYEFEKLQLVSSQDSAYREIHIRSQFADVDMTGDYHLASLDESFYGLANKVFPSLFKYEVGEEIPNEVFNLQIMIKDLSALTAIFYPELDVAPYSKIGMRYDSDFEMLELSAQSDFINYGDMRFVNFRMDTTQKFVIFDPFYTVDIHADSAIFGGGVHFENLSILSDLYNDDLHTEIMWYKEDSTYWGALESDIDIRSSSKMMFALHPSDIYHEKLGLWSIERDAFVKIDSTSLKFDNFRATNAAQSVKLLGTVSEDPDDRLKVLIGQFNMNNLDAFMTDSTQVRGTMTATAYITDVYHDMYYDAYCWVDDFQLDEYEIGDLELVAGWNPLDERIEITGDIFDATSNSVLKIEKGYYYIKQKENNLDFDINFNETDLAFANVFMPDGFSNLQGILKGNVYVKGSTSVPELNGLVNLHDAGLKIDMLNTSYYADGDVIIEPDMILLNGIPIRDKLGAKGFLNGSFFHQNFEKYSYDFYAAFDEPFLVMNTTYDMNPLYYGNAFATGDFSIAYDDYNELEIMVIAKSEKGTDITLPLYGSEDVELQDFISFVSNDSTQQEEEYDVDLEGIEMTLSMDITEDAKIQLVFDDIVGDAMQGTGEGHIDMYIDQFYDFYMFGSYEVYQGSYLFTLKDLLNKKFEVEKGGTINWYGDPYEADIDLTAIYKLKTSLYDIMPENQREAYRQKTDVETHMHLTDNLFNPILNFDIELPRSDENAKTILSNMVSTEAEMNKQVFSLLLLNKFLPSEYNTTGSSSGGTAALGNTTSEMLSNQLSNMLSKFSDDFDIGFNYQPGDEVTSQEVALALSTQLFDDRLTITTNLGVSHQNAGDNSNSLIGDVDVEYKINEEGNTRIHGFNRSNEYDITQQEATYTQGVGVFYQESFSTFPELICKLKNIFIREENECGDCNANCNQYLTEEEKQKCKEQRKADKKACREKRKERKNENQ
ncbi:translocation/assembly module TamB domain-containing protein [Parvicella tangerina]|uniref:translocation/assembly module TamB domain-containing protein n=1 Tax=Parvicella tangerina TaxID=2829795 RepID=UPI00215C9F1C|nr:translocation/assembly module TamB [Parvicella tangerina]